MIARTRSRLAKNESGCRRSRFANSVSGELSVGGMSTSIPPTVNESQARCFSTVAEDAVVSAQPKCKDKSDHVPALISGVGMVVGAATALAGATPNFLASSSNSGAGSFLSPKMVHPAPESSALLPAASVDAAEEASPATAQVHSVCAAVGGLVAVGSAAVRGTRPRTKKSKAVPAFGATASQGLIASGRLPGRGGGVACHAMFERFGEKAMKAVMMAQAESRKLSHDHVGTEMLVVGVIAEGSDMGAVAMRELGVGVEEARTRLEQLVGHGSGGRAIEVPFTEGAKLALELAIDCAREQGSVTISTGHILQAVLRRGDGVGAKLMIQLLGVETADAALEKLQPKLVLQPSNQNPVTAKEPQAVSDDLELTETLKYARDLTQAARDGKLDPLIGREQEFERTVRILGRRSKNNPVLVGEAGVGKTSIAHGLASRIAAGVVPQNLRDKRVIQLDLAMLLAGTRYRGDFEERLRAVVGEVQACGRKVVLVIDEIHTLVGAGGSGGEGGGMDAANLLKPALARGELQCIGATTLDEYRKYIEKDPALERRFQPVNVPEPTEEETLEILTALAPKYEQHHQLTYTPEALKLAVKLASQYINDRFLPDKAIDVMDEAGSKVRQQVYSALHCNAVVQEEQAIKSELEGVRAKKKTAVSAENYEEASELKQREVRLLRRLEQLEAVGCPVSGPKLLLEELQAIRTQIRDEVIAEHFDEACELKVRETKILKELERLTGSNDAAVIAANLDPRVTEQDVAQVVASWTGIAVEDVSADESARLLRLEDVLHERVIGQEDAVKSVSLALRRARAGLRNPTRPIAGFMFSGPTGVGKTELCKTLAQSFFGSEESMIRLDMSEFMERHTVSKLIGSPPGYVGYDEGGALTEAVRRRPYSLVLFDEVEKAHPDVFNLMLQLLDDGRLTDSKGRTVSFANALIVMTTNLGSRSVEKGAAGGGGLGFGVAENQNEANYEMVKGLVHEEMKSFFRPEFLNRLDEIVVFRPLTKEDVKAIAELEFKKVIARLAEQDFDISLTANFKEHVVEQGFDPAYGARPLRRAITRLLEDNLAAYVLADGAAVTKQDPAHEKHGAAGETPDKKVVRLVVDVDGHGAVNIQPRASATDKSKVTRM